MYIIYIVIYLYKKFNTKRTYAKTSTIHTEEGNENPSQKPHPPKQSTHSRSCNTAIVTGSTRRSMDGVLTTEHDHRMRAGICTLDLPSGRIPERNMQV